MEKCYAIKLKRIKLPLYWVYDTFSATLAVNYSDCIFISGYGFAASFYGLPDIG
jgi:2-methylisocitrate lyase-like PEP mutase family enzyme